MKAHSSRPEAPLAIASADGALNDALARLLAEFGPEIIPDQFDSVCAEVGRRRGLRLLIVAELTDDSSALDLLQAVKEQRPDVAVLLLSTHPTVDHATESIRRGAEDFVPVPYSDEVVHKEVARILEAADLRDQVDRLGHLVQHRYGFDRIISRSKRMTPVFDRATAAGRSDTPVLILGETGTGKELIARAIHANGRRANRPFVAINCAALPKDLVESELFGHRRGAFSGAMTDHPGLFTTANGGTLFLDEIGELPLDVQAKLLRVLQDGEVRPVGGIESRRVDVRIVAATNRSLAEMRDGQLRHDLFYRLSVLVIEIPPLREHRDDLPLLVAHFLSAIHDRGGPRVDGFEPAALELLADYPFPGNVRELENLVEALVALLPPGRTTVGAAEVRNWMHITNGNGFDRTSDATGVSLNLARLEAWAIGEAIRKAQGNKSLAAQILGISRDTLYRKLQ